MAQPWTTVTPDPCRDHPSRAPTWHPNCRAHLSRSLASPVGGTDVNRGRPRTWTPGLLHGNVVPMSLTNRPLSASRRQLAARWAREWGRGLVLQGFLQLRQRFSPALAPLRRQWVLAQEGERQRPEHPGHREAALHTARRPLRSWSSQTRSTRVSPARAPPSSAEQVRARRPPPPPPNPQPLTHNPIVS